MSPNTPTFRSRVLIAGGGVGGLEAALALQALIRERRGKARRPSGLSVMKEPGCRATLASSRHRVRRNPPCPFTSSTARPQHRARPDAASSRRRARVLWAAYVASWCLPAQRSRLVSPR